MSSHIKRHINPSSLKVTACHGNPDKCTYNHITENNNKVYHAGQSGGEQSCLNYLDEIVIGTIGKNNIFNPNVIKSQKNLQQLYANLQAEATYDYYGNTKDSVHSGGKKFINKRTTKKKVYKKKNKKNSKTKRSKAKRSKTKRSKTKRSKAKRSKAKRSKAKRSKAKTSKAKRSKAKTSKAKKN